MLKKNRFIFAIASILFLGLLSAWAVEEEYRISKDDILDINVYEERDLSLEVRVSPDGTITYPFLGVVEAEGLTAKELEKKLADLLAQDYLVNPQVTVFIKEYAKIFVLGQVKKPGAYELKGGLTVIEAIALAGGLSDIAAPNGTKVIRGEGEKKKVFNIPVAHILGFGDKSRDMELKPGDTVVVPESFF